jgi:hypothetical protein
LTGATALGINRTQLTSSLYSARDEVREMALRAAGLSNRVLKAITDMINSARSVEELR